MTYLSFTIKWHLIDANIQALEFNNFLESIHLPEISKEQASALEVPI